jgi:hypothetical protein
MNPTKRRALRRLLPLLDHAEADTFEGRTAALVAAGLRERHRITDADIEAARTWRTSETRTEFVLQGWTEPWQVAVAGMIASAIGVSCKLHPKTRELAFGGRGAGKAYRRALGLRALLDQRVAVLGERGVRQLATQFNHAGRRALTVAGGVARFDVLPVRRPRSCSRPHGSGGRAPP